MYIKTADGTSYPIVRLGSRSSLDQSTHSLAQADFQITFEAKGQNITQLIEDIKTRFSIPMNLKDIQVYTDTMEYPSLFTFSSLGNIIMNVNASGVLLDVIFHRNNEV